MDRPTPETENYLAILSEDDDINLSMALRIILAAPFPMVLSDPARDDNPIVFVNKAFERMTGYSMSESIGRNCRFLQGKDTDPKAVARIRRALEASEEVSVDILNYRKDGIPFWNRLLIGPVNDDDETPRYFFGVQRVLGQMPPDMADTQSPDFMLREIQHRVKNHLNMVVSLIRLQSREDLSLEGFDKLARRVESLQLLYEELNASGGENRDAVSLGSYLGRIVNSVADLDGQGKLLVDFDIHSFAVPLETAVRCGLIVSEAVTNAIKHAFEGREQARIALSVREIDTGGVRIEVSDNGNGLAEGASWPSETSLGGRLILGLAESLEGSVGMTSGPEGSVVRLDLPRSARGEH